MTVKRLLSFGLLTFTGIVAACSAADTKVTTGSGAGGSADTLCAPGHKATCECLADVQGLKTCLPDGSGFGECVCNTTSGEMVTTSGAGGAPSPCPNKVCDDTENCHTCEVDCGVCAPCDIAPKCDNVTIPPAKLTAFPQLDVAINGRVPLAEDRARLSAWVQAATPAMRLVVAALDQPTPGEPAAVNVFRQAFLESPEDTKLLREQLVVAGLQSVVEYRAKFPVVILPVPPPSLGDADPPGGTLECGAPLLRIGISEIKVPNKDSYISGDTIYCLTQAEALSSSEIRIVGPTGSIGEGKSQVLSIASGILWGQKKETTPGGTIQITYDCFSQKDNAGYAALVDGIGKAAKDVGGVVPGDAGYVLTGIGGVSGIVSVALGLVKDLHLLNKQQTIPLDTQMKLTNGGTWTVKAKGDSSPFGTYEWHLIIKAWGCAEYGTL